MKLEIYSHHNETNSISAKLKESMNDTLQKIDFKIYQGSSKKLRENIMDQLISKGWSGKVEIDAGTKITITSLNSGYGLCLQTGNMSRFYADLLKLECLYKKKRLNGAFYIIPSRAAAGKLGSNIANFDRLVQELQIFKDVITIPIHVIGLS